MTLELAGAAAVFTAILAAVWRIGDLTVDDAPTRRNVGRRNRRSDDG